MTHDERVRTRPPHVLEDPSALFARADAYRTMTPADVQRVARRLFEGKPRATVAVMPKRERVAA